MQVGLFNLMEEKDVQIKGYKIRLPVDLVFVASANPEDYTSRGRIITPLKDRFDVQIRTHYPKTIEDEIAIMEQEAAHPPRVGHGGADSAVHEGDPRADYLRGAGLQRDQPDRRGCRCALRSTISNRRSPTPRSARCETARTRSCRGISDLHSLYASTAGKIELEYVGEDKKEEDLIERLINRAVLKVFDRYLKLDDLKKVIELLRAGLGGRGFGQRAVVGIHGTAARGAGLREVITLLGPFETPGLMAAASEFIFEGLHLHQKLNKERQGGRFAYHA